jgi:hypothetical protein
MATNAKISIHVNQQLPSHVREEYGTFVSFLEAYYEYLEQSNNTVAFGKVTERTRNLRDYRDVDKTLSDFSERLYSEFLQLIPKNTVADKDVIIKNVKDFYRARGTEKALKFLLRILIGKEATIYYPKRDILRASDGKWHIQKSLRINHTQIDSVSNSTFAALQAYRSTRITGNTSNATAVVEKVDRFVEGGTQIDELILSGIRGTFSDGEQIRTFFREGETQRFLASNVFAGIINTLSIDNPGLRYNVGDYLIFTGGGGANANAVVSRVTSGNITSVVVINGGAGFHANDFLIFTGGGGSGANAKVATANTDESYHPNSYANLCLTLIRDLAGTTMNTANYPNMNYSIVNSPNANTRMIDALKLFSLTNVGPVDSVTVSSSGSGYVSQPSVGAAANSKLAELGILGRMRIINGGLGYNRGDVIEYFNIFGGSGTGAKGNVVANAVNGMITQVKFVANTGYEPVGGWGYASAYKPRVNVRSSTGTGANIVIEALLGEGDAYQLGSGSLGAILEVTITNRGDGFTTVPNVSVAGGDSNAQVSATIVRGAFTYPGRYLNDDGHLSSYNFLQNRDYYQNFSYVVRVNESLATYRKAVLDILHPGGLKLFGEHTHEAPELNVALSLVGTVNTGVMRAWIRAEGNASNFTGTSMPYRTMIANTGLRGNGSLVIALTAEINQTLNVTNVFVNNVEATKLVSANAVSASTNEFAGIYGIRNFSNTNAFINVVTSAAAMGNIAITTYRVKAANILQPLMTNSKFSTAAPQTMSLLGLRVEGNGSALIVQAFNDDTRTATWFGATEVDDVSIGTSGVRHSTAVTYNVGASGANTNVTVTMSAAGTRQAMAGVSWVYGV